MFKWAPWDTENQELGQNVYMIFRSYSSGKEASSCQLSPDQGRNYGGKEGEGNSKSRHNVLTAKIEDKAELVKNLKGWNEEIFMCSSKDVKTNPELEHNFIFDDLI